MILPDISFLYFKYSVVHFKWLYYFFYDCHNNVRYEWHEFWHGDWSWASIEMKRFGTCPVILSISTTALWNGKDASFSHYIESVWKERSRILACVPNTQIQIFFVWWTYYPDLLMAVFLVYSISGITYMHDKKVCRELKMVAILEILKYQTQASIWFQIWKERPKLCQKNIFHDDDVIDDFTGWPQCRPSIFLYKWNNKIFHDI